jgi:hypothetical protein
MKRIGIALALLILLAVAWRSAGDASFWRHYALAATSAAPDRVAAAITPRLRLAGDPQAFPRGTAESESIAPEALTQTSDRAHALKTRALIVHRHGHRVLDVFSTGTSGATPVTGGELTPAIFALALSPLVDTRRMGIDAAVQAVRQESAVYTATGWRNPWSAAARTRFSLHAAPQMLRGDGSVAQTLSERVWLPLHAQHASLWGSDDKMLRVDCCIVAQLDDWMRVGDVLLQQGNFEGERIASPDWIRALLAADLDGRRHPVWLKQQQGAEGAEPPAARDTFWFDLGPGLRLWLVPRRALSVLIWTETALRARDTEIPNLLIRGLIDQAPAIDAPSALDQIVPGH